jgi:hypothetical protein
VLEARIAPGFARAIELREDVLLERHVLEGRLDHEVGLAEVAHVEGGVRRPMRVSTSPGLRRPLAAVAS